MPCPYFHPTNPVSLGSLPHPDRLSLRNAYAGHCTAANLVPTEAMLHDCNLGYADCAHLPADRPADAIRFAIRRDQNSLIAISYVSEAAHTPVAHGVLIYDLDKGSWRERHSDACLQRMAECCIASLRKEQ